MRTTPQVARTAPYYVELRRGQSVIWCRCGRSARQPWCDGSHAGTGMTPLAYRAADDEEVLFCGCKQTCTPPFCDGSHNALLPTYASDDPQSAANRAIRLVEAASDGKARIDGGCFVCSPQRLRWHVRPGVAWAEAVGADDGARHQSLFCLDVAPGPAPAIAFGDSQVALLFAGMTGALEIGAAVFRVEALQGRQVGACVLPGETFRIVNEGVQSARVIAAVGPLACEPGWPTEIDPWFDRRHLQRLVPVDPALRQSMADRFFQVLVGPAQGAATLTQFIGEIPRSKALPHRHLYEETLVVLDGEGMMWTETTKALVAPGDIIFLPRKQLHSLECTSDRPMLLAGAIHPGSNPSINYY